MTKRLSKVAIEFNVGIETLSEFLQKKGHSVEADPNAKISADQYDELSKEFKKDKVLKVKSEQTRMEYKKEKKEAREEARREEKAREEAQIEEVSAEQAEAVQPEEKAPETHIETEIPKATVKTVGHIDLDALKKGRRGGKKKNNAQSKAAGKTDGKKTGEPKAAAKDEKKSVKAAEKKDDTKDNKETDHTESMNKNNSKSEKDVARKGETKKEEIKKEETKKNDGIFELHPEGLKTNINVVGKIDLSAINQSTRPKKKTKEERRKEREKRQHGGKAGAAGDAQGNRRGRRKRIDKERVDIDKAGKNAPKKGQGRGRGRGKKATRPEVTDEDVAKQVKETLARLTNKGKNRGAKYRKEKRESVQRQIARQEREEQQDSKVLKLTEFVTVSELANLMDISVNDLITTCISIGLMVSINQRLDADAIKLLAENYGFTTEFVSHEVAQAIVEEPDAEEDLEPRAPIVTVMGHVDHGKTSLLDYIRRENVIAGEAGGITQHIGAYNVELDGGRHITFLDTPGHEAFTAMRARGAKVTDVAIVIIAADDEVMPQTKEAINHAAAAGVPIVFAINKVDKPTANPDKIKEQLSQLNYLVEEWGGEYQSQDISAKKGEGVPELLEKVLLQADMLDLQANPDRNATGTILESTLDKGRGYVASLLVSNGTLHVGDIILAGMYYGRVKAMFNERGHNMEEAGPSQAVQILGFNGAPAAGDTFHIFETDQEAREIAQEREQLQRELGLRTQKMLTLDEVGRRLALGEFHELNMIVKGDVDGSVEALGDSLEKLSTEKIQVNVIHKGVGQITESDVTLAAASDAIIIGFQVRPSAQAARMAEQDGVDIRKYSVIYDAIDEVKSAMEGMLEPTVKEKDTALIEVRDVFNISKVGTVAGAYVLKGRVHRSDKARVVRDGVVKFDGPIKALKRFKDDVKEVGVNFECGISLVNFDAIKVGDQIETYEEVEVKQKL